MSKSPADLGGPERVKRTLANMQQNIGFVPGFRRAHARGVALRGQFTATPEVAAMTSAEHMQGDPIPVTARLSNGSGSPYAVDRSSVKVGATLGLAVRFALPSGDSAEWAALNIDDFPARIPEDFERVAGAQKKDRMGKPNPLRLVAFIATHRHTLPGLLAILRVPTSKSFATNRFNGLHAYLLVDADGTRRPFRYRWIPRTEPAGAGITREEDRLLPPQYLISEIKLRVGQARVYF